MDINKNNYLKLSHFDRQHSEHRQLTPILDKQTILGNTSKLKMQAFLNKDNEEEDDEILDNLFNIVMQDENNLKKFYFNLNKNKLELEKLINRVNKLSQNTVPLDVKITKLFESQLPFFKML